MSNKAKMPTQVETGSGDVFADLGYADAKERRLKVRLALKVNQVLEKRGLPQASAAKLFGLREPHVSNLVRYRLNRFSVERLMEFLILLGKKDHQETSRNTSSSVK